MTLFGWDMSNWDNPSIGNAVAEGFSFITHKAGGDTSGGDQELGAWWQSVKGTDPAKTLVGSYWVPRPDMYPNAAGEVNRWLSRLDSQCPGWRDRPHILQIDAEIWNGDSSTKPGYTYLKTMADKLKSLMPKLRPIIYAPQWTYGDSLSGIGYPLWASRYVNGSGTAASLYPGDNSSFWNAYSGQIPAILQFTSSATIAGQTTSDANAYRGTFAQLVALVAPGWSIPDVELTDQYGDRGWSGRTVADRYKDDAGLRDVLWGDGPGTQNAPNLPSTAPLASMIASARAMPALAAAVSAIGTKLDADTAELDARLSGILSAVNAEPDALMSKLTAAGRAPQDVAAALVAALGQDDAAAVAKVILGQ